MPTASGFSPDINPNYYVRKPAKDEYSDESIYYKREIPPEKPIEVVKRPVVKETIFLPDRATVGPTGASSRNTYSISPERDAVVYATIETSASKGTFDPIRALGLNADCPCWAWILIVGGLVLLLALIGICLYFVLDRERRI